MLGHDWDASVYREAAPFVESQLAAGRTVASPQGDTSPLAPLRPPRELAEALYGRLATTHVQAQAVLETVLAAYGRLRDLPPQRDAVALVMAHDLTDGPAPAWKQAARALRALASLGLLTWDDPAGLTLREAIRESRPLDPFDVQQRAIGDEAASVLLAMPSLPPGALGLVIAARQTRAFDEVVAHPAADVHTLADIQQAAASLVRALEPGALRPYHADRITADADIACLNAPCWHQAPALARAAIGRLVARATTHDVDDRGVVWQLERRATDTALPVRHRLLAIELLACVHEEMARWSLTRLTPKDRSTLTPEDWAPLLDSPAAAVRVGVITLLGGGAVAGAPTRRPQARR